MVNLKTESENFKFLSVVKMMIMEDFAMFVVLGGGLLVIIIAVVIAVVSSVVSAVAADLDDQED